MGTDHRVNRSIERQLLTHIILAPVSLPVRVYKNSLTMSFTLNPLALVLLPSASPHPTAMFLSLPEQPHKLTPIFVSNAPLSFKLVISEKTFIVELSFHSQSAVT
jgi:hypothetical protein